MAAVRSGDPAVLAGVLSRQRVHLLRELRGLADARALGRPSAVESLLIDAADLHIRADLGVVDAAEKTLTPDVLTALGRESGPGAAPSAAAPSAAAVVRQESAPPESAAG